MSKDLSEQFKTMLIDEGAKQDLQKLLKGDKEMGSKKKDVDFLDAFWQKHEKQIDEIQKKYKLGLDELGELLMSLKESSKPLTEALKLAKMKEGGDTLSIGLDSDGALHVKINSEYIIIEDPNNLAEIKKALKGL